MAIKDVPKSLVEAAFLEGFFSRARRRGSNPRQIYRALKKEFSAESELIDQERFDGLVERVQESADIIHSFKIAQRKAADGEAYLQNPERVYRWVTGRKPKSPIACRSLNIALAFYLPFGANGFNPNHAGVTSFAIEQFMDSERKNGLNVPVLYVNSDHKSEQEGRLLSDITGEDIEQRQSLEHELKHKIDYTYLRYNGCLGEFSATLHQPSYDATELYLAYCDDLQNLKGDIIRQKDQNAKVKEQCSSEQLIETGKKILERDEILLKQANFYRGRITRDVRDLMQLGVKPRTLSYIVSVWASLKDLHKELVTLREYKFGKAA